MYVSVDGLLCDLSKNGPCIPCIPGTTDSDNAAESNFVLFVFCCFVFPLLILGILRKCRWRRHDAARQKTSPVNKAHKLHAGAKHPAFFQWLARCKRLGLSGKTSKRLWRHLLKGLQLANREKVGEANLIFQHLAQQVAELCPDHMHHAMQRAQPVLWSGSKAQTMAQDHGFTMEKCALGILLGDLDLLDHTQADAWRTLRPAWVAFSRYFVNMLINSGHKTVLVFLSKSSPATIFREEELPLLLRAGIDIDCQSVLPTRKRSTLCEAIHLLQVFESIMS